MSERNCSKTYLSIFYREEFIMKCQKCNEREANTHIQKIVNGKKTEYFLCSKCAAESGELKFNFDGDFDDFFGGFFGKGVSSFPSLTDKTCGVCNMKLSEFLKHGKLGCSNCYTVRFITECIYRYYLVFFSAFLTGDYNAVSC